MEEREGDIRVPLISCFLFLLVTIGGVFLVLYIYLPANSQPWFPVAALLLIGSPWIFWVLTFLYSRCIKRCFRGSTHDDRQISRRRSWAAADNAAAGMSRNDPAAASGKSKNDARQVEIENTSHKDNGDVSVATSMECEMPLTSSLPS